MHIGEFITYMQKMHYTVPKYSGLELGLSWTNLYSLKNRKEDTVLLRTLCPLVSFSGPLFPSVGTFA